MPSASARQSSVEAQNARPSWLGGLIGVSVRFPRTSVSLPGAAAELLTTTTTLQAGNANASIRNAETLPPSTQCTTARRSARSGRSFRRPTSACLVQHVVAIHARIGSIVNPPIVVAMIAGDRSGEHLLNGKHSPRQRCMHQSNPLSRMIGEHSERGEHGEHHFLIRRVERIPRSPGQRSCRLLML